MSDNITHVSDADFQNEVLSSDVPVRRFLGGMVRTLQNDCTGT